MNRPSLVILAGIVAVTGFPGVDRLGGIIAAEPDFVSQSVRVGNRSYQVLLPDGYVLEYLNQDMRAPRMIFFAGNRLLVGSRSGAVYWLDPPYVKSNILVRLDDYPHSVVVRGNNIYVARTRGIYQAGYNANTESLKKSDFRLVVPLPGSPSDNHTSRTLKLGPDNRLYVSLGISGNCTDQYLDSSYPPSARRGGILQLREDGDGMTLRPYGTGLRNPVGFDWQPGSGVLYASNNGPDHAGFEQPPEYFSRITPGSFHGMPWFQFNGKEVVRDDCVSSSPPLSINQVQVPVATFPARNAPMDVAFFPDSMVNPKYRDDAIVALRGSWAVNRQNGKSGGPETRRPPKLVRVEFEGDRVIAVRNFLTGFQLSSGKRWARPVGVAFGPDGSLYFTSDSNNQGLYRLRRKM